MKRLVLVSTGLLLLVGCNLFFDRTPPVVTITAPLTNTSVSGTVTIKVNAVDDESGVRSIAVLIDDQVRDSITFTDEPLPRGGQSFSYAWDTTVVPDGTYVITARAVNGVGGEGLSAEVVVATSNPGAAPPAAPSVAIDPDRIQPQASFPEGCTSPSGCYSGTVSVPVRVEAALSSEIRSVELNINSEALGTRNLSLSAPPYVFSVDTRDYPKNDRLTLRAKAVTTAGGEGVSDPVVITVFNVAPPPTLAITSPASGANISGDLFVEVAIRELTDSGYSLDLNDNGVVDEDEGFLIELIDFANVTVEERRINQSTTPNLDAEASGSYVTVQGIDTTRLASDTYTVRATLPLRFKPTGEVITLRRSIQINTGNVNRVPPSLLILAPTNEGPEDIKTIRDPDNAYVTVQATDNTGIAHIEIRMFQGDADADTTPSRFIYASGGETYTTVALPLNYNANPYLPDFAPYTVRVIAEDIDGNRAFQDMVVGLGRVAGGDYELMAERRVPDPDDPDEFIWVIAETVPRHTVVRLTVSGLQPGDRFDHLIRKPGDDVFRPHYGITGVSYDSYRVGLSEEGTYDFLTQVTRSDGSIYTTNFTPVTVLSE